MILVDSSAGELSFLHLLAHLFLAVWTLGYFLHLNLQSSTALFCSPIAPALATGGSGGFCVPLTKSHHWVLFFEHFLALQGALGSSVYLFPALVLESSTSPRSQFPLLEMVLEAKTWVLSVCLLHKSLLS